MHPISHVRPTHFHFKAFIFYKNQVMIVEFYCASIYFKLQYSTYFINSMEYLVKYQNFSEVRAVSANLFIRTWPLQFELRGLSSNRSKVNKLTENIPMNILN